MKIIVISDTHGLHRNLNMPDGDMLIHCGDITTNGTKEETDDFLSWFAGLDYKYKIFIAGNHDLYLEEFTTYVASRNIEGIIYLKDSGVEIEGIQFWGSPFTPKYKDQAFSLSRGEQMKVHWQKIPDNVDVLITHGPPRDIFDSVSDEYAGCQQLADRIKEVTPQMHLFGHIHESRGIVTVDETTYVNASMTNKKKELAFAKPFVFDVVPKVQG